MGLHGRLVAWGHLGACFNLHACPRDGQVSRHCYKRGQMGNGSTSLRVQRQWQPLPPALTPAKHAGSHNLLTVRTGMNCCDIKHICASGDCQARRAALLRAASCRVLRCMLVCYLLVCCCRVREACAANAAC